MRFYNLKNGKNFGFLNLFFHFTIFIHVEEFLIHNLDVVGIFLKNIHPNLFFYFYFSLFIQVGSFYPKFG
jgi:hypothetical protein